MMTLADGNISEYKVIMSLSVEDYLLKFEQVINDIEIKQRHNIQQR